MKSQSEKLLFKINCLPSKIPMNTSYASSLGHTPGNQFAQTPPDVFVAVERHCLPMGETFDFDPCPANPEFNGLAVPWGQRNFVNPPYNDITHWLLKGQAEARDGKLSCFLLPFRPTTKYFSTMLLYWDELREVIIIKERIKFQGYAKPAMFQNCVVVLSPGPHPRLERPWLHIYRAAKSQTPQEVVRQIGRQYETEIHCSVGPSVLRGNTFITTTRNVAELPARAIAHVAETGFSLDLLVPIRDSARSTYEVFLNPTHENRPAFVAPVTPHLTLNDKGRSPYPSMLCMWKAPTDPLAIGCHPVLSPVHLLSLQDL
jgi:hypothetical protein